jgi:cytochrome c oxidase cbb3-type subunit III
MSSRFRNTAFAGQRGRSGYGCHPERSEGTIAMAFNRPFGSFASLRMTIASLRMTIFATTVLTLVGCQREERNFQGMPPSATSTMPATRQTGLQPGPPVRSGPMNGPYEQNAYGVSQGKTLYNQFNCSGCHFQGGGGIGPPLMDDQWVYGSSPENIFETIVEGRPNGMPSFGGKISPDQIWQITAYVRSMSGLLRKDVATGRNDDMQVRSQEQAADKAKPVQSVIPPSAERQ